MLIHGASGNVGRYAVQLAHHSGIEVLATASTRAAATSPQLGVKRIVDPETTGVTVDAVLDLIRGTNQSLLFNWLSSGGALISAVGQPDTVLAENRGIRAAFILVEIRSEILKILGALFDAGIITPKVGEILPLSAARTAHEMLAGVREHSPGKMACKALILLALPRGIEPLFQP